MSSCNQQNCDIDTPDFILELCNTYLATRSCSGNSPPSDELYDFPCTTSEFSDSQQSLSGISVSELITLTSEPYDQSSLPDGASSSLATTATATSVEEPTKLIASHTDEEIMVDRKTGILPSTNEDFGGIYNFEITFEPQKKITKSATWTFSEVLGKLYADMGKPCPVHFHAGSGTPGGSGHAVPSGTVIRCLPMYVSPEHRADAVVRCPNHTVLADNSFCSGREMAPPSHFVRCDDRDRRYDDSKVTGQQSVIVPFRPHDDSGLMTVVYRFMCFSSCVGNLGRRQIQAVFSLESADGRTLGRRTIELRICACPGRDRRNDELALSTTVTSVARPLPKPLMGTKDAAPSTSRVASKRTQCAVSAGAVPSGEMLKTSDASDDDDDQVYMLKVRGAKSFKILSQLNEALELKRQHDKRAMGTSNLHKAANSFTPSTTGNKVTKKSSPVRQECLETDHQLVA